MLGAFYRLAEIIIARWHWLKGADLDEGGFGDVDGVSIFQFLALFTTTQGAAFVVAVQGSDGEKVWMPTLILWGLSGFTICAIVRYLREPVRLYLYSRHTYTEGTIYFGRWALKLAFVLALAFPFLGYAGMLPGQDKRANYESTILKSLEPVRPASFSVIGLAGHDNHRASASLKLFAKGLSTSSDCDQIVVEQDGVFDTNYHTFTCWAEFRPPVRAISSKLFLVRGAASPFSAPSLDEMRSFPDVPIPFTQEVYEITKPNKGDFVVLILELKVRPGETLKMPLGSPSDYHIVLRSHR
jgi:hypothetical protein